MRSVSDFCVESGVLTKYRGPGGDATIRSGATGIGVRTFRAVRA